MSNAEAAGGRHPADALLEAGSGWLPAAVELEAFEGIRAGDEHAFRLVAEPLQPALRRLAGLDVDPGPSTVEVVRHTWEVALRGLDMFRWSTPLATWVASIAVTFGRTHDVRATTPFPPPRTPDAQAEPSPGPLDWSDLPWGARWGQAASTLVDALAALPRAQREVIHGRDLEQWPPRRVCDVFGITESRYHQLVRDGRTRLHRSLELLVGQSGRPADREAQLTAVTRWLGLRLDPQPERLDQGTSMVFHRWVASRRRGLRRVTLHVPHLARHAWMVALPTLPVG